MDSKILKVDIHEKKSNVSFLTVKLGYEIMDNYGSCQISDDYKKDYRYSSCPNFFTTMFQFSLQTFTGIQHSNFLTDITVKKVY